MRQFHDVFYSYNRNPSHLQAVIRKVFELGTKKITLNETEYVPIPLFEALDGDVVFVLLLFYLIFILFLDQEMTLEITYKELNLVLLAAKRWLYFY